MQGRHRRISSVGRSRRLSDARDAATRPVLTPPSSLQSSLAALSLASPTLPDDAPRRKRGSVFTCESCAKVYRHPSCLIKHRWEHTPHWREASKFVLSKHQQVQLLEAAAILSHLSPSSASLPEDRSLWPSFLSGGLVPPPNSTAPISSSVPIRTHDVGPTARKDDALNLLASTSLGARVRPRVHAHAHLERQRFGCGFSEGWLPRSSVRAQSASRSASQSASEDRSDDEDEVEVGVGFDDDDRKVEQWDGMEMEMEME